MAWDGSRPLVVGTIPFNLRAVHDTTVVVVESVPPVQRIYFHQVYSISCCLVLFLKWNFPLINVASKRGNYLVNDLFNWYCLT